MKDKTILAEVSVPENYFFLAYRFSTGTFIFEPVRSPSGREEFLKICLKTDYSSGFTVSFSRIFTYGNNLLYCTLIPLFVLKEVYCCLFKL